MCSYTFGTRSFDLPDMADYTAVSVLYSAQPAGLIVTVATWQMCSDTYTITIVHVPTLIVAVSSAECGTIQCDCAFRSPCLLCTSQLLVVYNLAVSCILYTYYNSKLYLYYVFRGHLQYVKVLPVAVVGSIIVWLLPRLNHKRQRPHLGCILKSKANLTLRSIQSVRQEIPYTLKFLR